MTRTRIIALLPGVVCLALALTGEVSGQQFAALRLYGGLGLSTTSYSPAAARQSNTVDRSFGLQSHFEPRFYDTVGLPVSIGWEYLGPVCLDIDSSVDCSAGREEKTSLLFGSIGAALYGPPIPFEYQDEDSNGRPFLMIGREWVSRGIGDRGCLNCILESVQFDGGLFVEPGVEVSAGRHLNVSFSYRLYGRGSDLENRLGLRFATRGR